MISAFPSEREVEVFFFKAIMKGWVSGEIKPKEVNDMPGFREIYFREGNLSLGDRYCTDEHSPKSAGSTTIWMKDKPIWIMHYGGFYKSEATRLLKKVLRLTYEAGTFIGGRGPRSFAEGGLSYVNQVKSKAFTSFDGEEEIRHLATGTLLGSYKYIGMGLLS